MQAVLRPPVKQSSTPASETSVMGCFVYVLGAVGPRGPLTYVGWTVDLDARLKRHNAGTGARSTRGRAWVLLYAERYTTRGEAMSREVRLKRDRVLRTRLRDTIGACA
jgi:putative endonuclease